MRGLVADLQRAFAVGFWVQIATSPALRILTPLTPSNPKSNPKRKTPKPSTLNPKHNTKTKPEERLEPRACQQKQPRSR